MAVIFNPPRTLANPGAAREPARPSVAEAIAAVTHATFTSTRTETHTHAVAA
jgi:hypothetical protein